MSDNRRPPRFSPTVSAAPNVPIIDSAGVPRARVASSQRWPGAGRLRSTPRKGAASASGRPVVSQWAAAFASAMPSRGMGAVARRSSEPSSRSSAKMRSSDRSEARSAPTQRMPGAIRDRRPASGPTPKGTSVTRMRKNASARPKPPPARTARRRSRAKSASMARSRPHPVEGVGRAGLHRGGMGGDVEHRRVELEVDMGGDEGGPARREMGAEDIGEAGGGHRVERDGGLVEQPDRSAGDEKARKPEGDHLTGGEVGGGPGEKRAETEGRHGALDPVRTEDGRPERQVLGHGERRLQPVGMGGVGHRLRAGTERAGVGGLEARERAQERRLARPVRSAQDEGAPRRHLEGEPFEKRQAAARDGETFDGEAQAAAPASGRAGGSLRRGYFKADEDTGGPVPRQTGRRATPTRRPSDRSTL